MACVLPSRLRLCRSVHERIVMIPPLPVLDAFGMTPEDFRTAPGDVLVPHPATAEELRYMGAADWLALGLRK